MTPTPRPDQRGIFVSIRPDWGVDIGREEFHTIITRRAFDHFGRGRKAVSAMQLDIERYRHHLDHHDLGEADKVRFLEQLWCVAQSCVDRAWGDAPEQILLGIDATKCPARAHDRLELMDRLTQIFNDAATGDAAREAGP